MRRCFTGFRPLASYDEYLIIFLREPSYSPGAATRAR
jgi:hypothetical protein